MDHLQDDSYKDSTLIMQLLRDNLTVCHSIWREELFIVLIIPCRTKPLKIEEEVISFAKASSVNVICSFSSQLWTSGTDKGDEEEEQGGDS